MTRRHTRNFQKHLFCHALLAVLILVKPVFAAEAAIKLNPQGTLRFQEKQVTLNPMCTSHRLWPEIDGLAAPAAQTALNAKFRKILTVDRPFSAADCPPDETYLYDNQASLTGQRKNYLGLKFSILFPGGESRLVNDCRIFNLETGQEIKVAKLLKSGSAKYLQDGYVRDCLAEHATPATPAEAADIKDQCTTNAAGAVKQLLHDDGRVAYFCLSDQGLSWLNPYGSLPEKIDLTAADKEKLFTASPVIDAFFKAP